MFKIDLIEFHSLYGAALNSESVVLDLGANLGRFSEKISKRFGCKCFGVEASPRIFNELQQRNCCTAFNLAITGKVETVQLQVSENNLGATLLDNSSDTTIETIEVQGMDLESFIKYSGIEKLDLIKVDIEGAEIAMFNACSDEFLTRIPQFTVEFHDFCGLNTPEEVSKVLKRLQGLGFRSIRFSRIGHQDTWLINTTLLNISNLKFAYAKYWLRNWTGALRVIRKVMMGKKWAEGYS